MAQFVGQAACGSGSMWVRQRVGQAACGSGSVWVRQCVGQAECGSVGQAACGSVCGSGSVWLCVWVKQCVAQCVGQAVWLRVWVRQRVGQCVGQAACGSGNMWIRWCVGQALNRPGSDSILGACSRKGEAGCPRNIDQILSVHIVQASVCWCVLFCRAIGVLSHRVVGVQP